MSGCFQDTVDYFFWVFSLFRGWHCQLDSNLREKRKFLIGLGYSSRQGAKNAKFGNLFCFFAAFASLREIILILVAGANPKFFVLHTSSQETQNSHFQWQVNFILFHAAREDLGRWTLLAGNFLNGIRFRLRIFTCSGVTP